MAQDELEGTVKYMHGAVEKGGSISRVKTYRDSKGKIIGYGPQERYTRQKRDYDKHPLSPQEITHQALWKQVCEQTKQELSDPVKRAAWQKRFDEQLLHITPDTPQELDNGARKVFYRFDAFVRSVLYREAKASQQN